MVLDQASAHVARLDALNHHVVVDTVTLARPALEGQRAASGSINLAEPLVEGSEAPATPQTSAAWRIDVEKARIEGGVIHVVDEAVRPAYRLDAFRRHAGCHRPVHRHRQACACAAVIRTAIWVRGGPRGVRPRAHVAGGQGPRPCRQGFAQRLYPDDADALNLEVQSGTADVALDFETAPEGKGRKFAVSGGEAVVADLRLALHGERDPLWRVPRLAASGLTLDAGTHKIEIASLSSTGGQMVLRRDPDGTFNFARMIKTTAATGRSSEHADDTWTVDVRHTSVDRYAIDVDDRQPSPPVVVQLREVALTADNLTNAHGKHATITAHSKLGEGGSLAIDGPFATNPVAGRWHVVAERLPLAPLQPYIDP